MSCNYKQTMEMINKGKKHKNVYRFLLTVIYKYKCLFFHIRYPTKKIINKI